MTERVLFAPGGATEPKQDDVIAALALIRQTGRVMTPFSESRTGPLTNNILVAVPPGSRLRVLRLQHHCDPELGQGIYPLVEITLVNPIRPPVIYNDKMEAGLPHSEWSCFEGADGEDLTLTLTTTGTIFFNARYEIF